jgi:peptidoglycan/LPS O-acetylase OafA/YrhL
MLEAQEEKRYFIGMTVQKIYLPPLTGLRALAALWVLLLHLNHALTAFFGTIPFFTPVIEEGYQGVDLFFALSGFVIAQGYADRLRQFNWAVYRDYLRARLARIYPLHLLMLLCVLALVKFAPLFGFSINRGNDYSWFDFVRNIFLVQAWQFPVEVNWNQLAWSISAEWFAYLLTPLFVALIWARQRRMALLVMAVFFLSIAPMAAAFHIDSRPSAYALFRIIGAFGAGMIANRLFREIRIPLNAFLMLVLVFLAAYLQQKMLCGINYMTVPFSVLLIYALAQQRGDLSRLLSTKFFDYCGRVSYSLYITQFVVLMLVKKVFPYEKLIGHPGWQQAGYLFGVCILVFVTAIAGYHVVEQPCRNYLRNKKASV